MDFSPANLVIKIRNGTMYFSQATLILRSNLRGVLDAVRESLVDGERQGEEIMIDVISHVVDLKEQFRDVAERAKLNAEKAQKDYNRILISVFLFAR